jgi:cytochrome d ubiquinol oxidase subunit I
MVVIGIIMTLVIALFFALFIFKKEAAFSRFMLVILFLNGFLGFLAVEFGWILTEVGRQPYAIAGILTTAAAFTTSPHVAEFGYIFPSLYMVLFIVTPWVLRRHFKKEPLDLDIDKKYF